MLTQPRSDSTAEILLWVGVLIGAILLLAVVIFAVRRRTLHRSDDAESDATVMESLRTMRDSGQMTNEEFDAARRAMVEKIRKDASGSRTNQSEGRPGR
jgi:uncharacterized membrane protein